MANKSFTFVYDKNSGSQNIDFKVEKIRELFDSNIKACNISSFNLFYKVNDDPQKWSDEKIEIMEENKPNKTSIEI